MPWSVAVAAGAWPCRQGDSLSLLLLRPPDSILYVFVGYPHTGRWLGVPGSISGTPHQLPCARGMPEIDTTLTIDIFKICCEWLHGKQLLGDWAAGPVTHGLTREGCARPVEAVHPPREVTWQLQQKLPVLITFPWPKGGCRGILACCTDIRRYSALHAATGPADLGARVQYVWFNLCSLPNRAVAHSPDG